MAYSQFLSYNNIGIAKNGTVITTGTFTPILMGNDAITWCNSNLYGPNSKIYTLQNIQTPNADYAALTYSYNNTMSEEFSAAWIFSKFTAVNDYIDIFNTRLGQSFALRIICTSLGATYCDAKFAIVYPGGIYTATSGRIFYDYYSNYTGFTTFSVLVNPDEQKAALFRLLWSNDIPATTRNSWTIFHDPNMAVQDFNNFSPVLYAIFADGVVPPTPGGDDPYGDDDYTESVGGDGDHDETSDTIETSPIPIAAATRCGMITAFVPTWGEIQNVADALLDPNIFQILSSTVVRASDVIIGLSTFPCIVPAANTATVTANFLGLNIGTGVVAHVADDQYIEVPCGDLMVNEYWGNCLDYNPYTSVSIFLPFCGMYELDVDEVMGKIINVTYRVDIFSGACLATIKIDGSVFYQYTGQCSSQIPLNSVSFDNFLSSMLDIGIATATGVAAVKGAAGAVAESEKAFSDAKSSEAKAALEDMFAAKDKYTKVKENSGANMLNAAVSSVVGGKGMYSHAGAMGGSPGFLAVKTPFLIIKRPEQIIPSMYGKFHGYPSNTTANLGDLTGYTVVSDIRLNIPEATVDEIIECEQLLKGGVVL